MLSKKVIFLTGATGNMGAATLAELAAGRRPLKCALVRYGAAS